MRVGMYGAAINKAVFWTAYEGRNVWGGDNQGYRLKRAIMMAISLQSKMNKKRHIQYRERADSIYL
jgi:hypothetical protein